MKNLKILLGLVLIVSLSYAQNSLAKIVDKEGFVSLRLSGDLSFSSVIQEDGMINSGDAIRTGENSFAELEFVDDESKVKIFQNSEMEVDEEYTSRKLVLNQGEILADISPNLATSYNLETPNKIVSFDNARFQARVNGGENITPLAGELKVTDLASGNDEILKPGSKDAEPEVTVAEEPAPTEPVTEADHIEPNNTVGNNDLAYAQQEETQTVEATEKNYEDMQESERNWNMGLGIGSVTIDGEIYNQISLRPEVRFGKLGIGLDLYFYFDEDGNIRKEDWDEFSDYLDKIYYLRWGRQGDPFFARAGALNHVTLGYGILMSGYSNAIEYPQVRNIGVHTGMKFDKLGWEIMVADIKEISGPGLVAGRVTYDLLPKFRLGGSFVADFNQYKGLIDTDGDNIPNDFDAFPKESFRLPEYYPENAFGFGPNDKLKGKKYSIDSDDDGIPDEIDYDIDGDGLTDNYVVDESKNLEDEDEIDHDPTPFDMEDQAKALSAVAFDAGIPIFEREALRIDLYGQSAFFLSEKITDYYTGEKFSPGWGVAVPGFRAVLFNLVNCNLEYRFSGENFLFNFWDRLYDMERVSIREKIGDGNQLWAYTKDELKLQNDPMKGVFGSIDFNMWDYLIFRTYYQHMMSKDDEIRSFRSSLSIPSGRIPKLAEATAFYQRNNDKNPFKFSDPSENTILGYRLGFEIGGGAVLSYVYQRTYRDINGDGEIDPEDEAVTINTVETGFHF